MTAKIIRITPDTVAFLDRVDPDIFDADIDADRLAAFVANRTHMMAVAVAGGLVVGQVRGMIHAQPDGPNQLYIDNLGVAPAHQRKGIATQLLKELLSWGSENGCDDAWVATELDNEAARGLYSRLTGNPEEAVAYFQIDLT